MSRPFTNPAWLRHKAVPLLLAALASVLLLAMLYQFAKKNADERLRQTAEYHLTRLTSNLRLALAKHAYLPSLLANNPQIRGYLANPARSEQATEALHQYLEKINNLSGTSDIYLMDVRGVTLAASNWRTPHSFVGKRFDFRPYFQQAMQGVLGRYYAVGTTSKARGYYFAQAVRGNNNQINGVLTVKIGIDDIEANWKDEPFRFLVSDNDGVIFMSNYTPWQLQTLYPLDRQQRENLILSLRYPAISQQSLNFQRNGSRKQPHVERIDGQNYLSLHQPMPNEGWQVHLLMNMAGSQQSALLTLAISAVLLILSVLLLYLLWKNQHQRRLFEQQAMEALEGKVEKRTRELRKTQEGLVQAAKMAALGQLAAGINHELNNPLGAIRSYADNALQFLDREQTEITRSNLLEITALTDRMAAITRQLKTFSRKSNGDISDCSLLQALNSARLIARRCLNENQAELDIQIQPEHERVLADIVWLEQILVNLLSNAAEALHEQPRRQLFISSERLGTHISLHFRDTGPGIAEQHLEHIFEEFFTTKSIGKGLGLGLAISYRLAHDMQGALTAGNHPEGGALFTLTLPAAQGSA